MATFRPPVVYTLPRVLPTTWGVERAHFRHYSALPVGVSVLKINGTYQTIQEPTIDQTIAAEEVYLGGHEYPLTAAQEAALTAAGYGAYIS